MDPTGKVKIGKVIDAHGIRGELSIFIFSGDISWLPKLQEVYIPRKNIFEKHVVVKKRAHKKGFICLLENFDNRNLAEEYKGREIWIDADIFVSVPGEALYLNEIMGFEIIDATLGTLGKISAFSTNGLQDLLVIQKGDAQIEIPFVKEFVSQMDFENNKIMMNLPEGLLEINEKE